MTRTEPTGRCLELTDAGSWRAWLETHHASSQGTWLRLYKAGYRQLGLGLDEAVEEALCWGWIDGKLRSRDRESFQLRFTPRRRGSVWSARNVRRVERLILEGRMTPWGLARIEEAKENGQWAAALAEEDADRIPDNLRRALSRRRGSLAAFRALLPSRRKQLLHWLRTAKRAETEGRRIQAILDEVMGT